jgi:hypothetical protein
MATSNLLLYPLDYPETISGPTELELRVAALELGLKLSELQLVQSRRENAQSTIDLRTEVGDIVSSHSRLSRSSIPVDLFGRKGFFIGGETASSLTDKIYRLNFLTEEMYLSGASLGTARHSGSAASSTQNAFIAGGNTTSNISGQIDRLSFSRETIGQLSVGLIVPRSETAAWSTAKQSYFWGGANDGGAFSASIEALSQPANLIRSLGVSLGVARSNAVSLSSNINGYAVGGKTALGQNFASSIYKFNYGAETIAPAGFALTTATGFATGTGNQAVGYIIGGRTAVGVGTIGTISRVNYGTGTILPISIALSVAKSDLSSCGSSDKGYIAGGGISNIGEFRSNTETATIERLSFASQSAVESISILSIQLGSPAVGSMAVSDYAPAIQSAKSKTIQGQFDPFYSKIDHRHDDRYSLLAHRHDDLYPLITDVYYRPDLRQKLNANLNLFVDIGNVNPAALGLGTAANPFNTITAAIAYARKFDFNNYTLKIKVANGIYPESVYFDMADFVGLQESGITFEGNTQNPAAVVVAINPTTRSTAIRIYGELRVRIRGFKLTSTRSIVDLEDSRGIAGDRGAIFDYGDIIFGSGFSFQIIIERGSWGYFSGNVKIAGDCFNHIRLRNGGLWTTGSSVAFATIDIPNPITVDALIECSYGGLFNVGTSSNARLLQFTGAAVTGHSFVLDESGEFYHGPLTGFDRDAPDWSFIPGSSGARDFRRWRRFGVKNTDRRLYYPDSGQQMLWGRTPIYGSWQAGGALFLRINFNQIPGFTNFNYPPTVIATVDRLAAVQALSDTTGFQFIGDQANAISQPNDGIISWIAIGY